MSLKYSWYLLRVRATQEKRCSSNNVKEHVIHPVMNRSIIIACDEKKGTGQGQEHNVRKSSDLLLFRGRIIIIRWWRDCLITHAIVKEEQRGNEWQGTANL
jgi:hypothetical protein